jgi:hypothetical protein
VRLVAIHKDVVAEMRKWEAEGNHKVAKGKMLAACEAFLERDDRLYEALLRQSDCEKLKNGSGVLELGPKQKKGGAPRLFMLRRKDALVLLAAGVEKGNRGVKEMEVATERAALIPSADALGSPRAAGAALGTTYQVLTEVPIQDQIR